MFPLSMIGHWMFKYIQTHTGCFESISDIADICDLIQVYILRGGEVSDEVKK